MSRRTLEDEGSLSAPALDVFCICINFNDSTLLLLLLVIVHCHFVFIEGGCRYIMPYIGTVVLSTGLANSIRLKGTTATNLDHLKSFFKGQANNSSLVIV